MRLLGPLRSVSQVEISRTDARTLGVAAPLRMSGDLKGTPGIRLVSPFGELELASGVIVAQRHIHMSPLDALILRVAHGDRVSVAIEGDARGLIFNNVAVRVSPDMRLEMHIDTDEANAAGADNPQVFARLEAWKPELLLISAGFDAHADDPLAGLEWQAEDFGWLTRELVARSGGRVVSTLEGGYDLDALAASVAAHVDALRE